jgi:type II secretory pathway pseudopilin PulG
MGPRRRVGQGGQSLVEVLVALALLSGALLTVLAGLFTVIRATDANERNSAVNTALLSYGEIVRGQVAFRNCTASGTNTLHQGYTADALTKLANVGVSTTAPVWAKPADMDVRVVSVKSWDNATAAWATGCVFPETGLQSIQIEVKYGGVTRTADVIKRKGAPAS